METASLASVAPPDVWYRLAIPDETISSGSLSALQLEAITYTSQQHEQFLPDKTRAGFLIGDGAGVGKGRTVSGVIFENYLRGRKVSQFSNFKLFPIIQLDCGSSIHETSVLSRRRRGIVKVDDLFD